MISLTAAILTAYGVVPVALVRAGATFVNGKLVERPDDHHQPEAA